LIARILQLEKQMPLELVVFDMAGTTVYDGDAVHTCLADALQAAGIEVTRDHINAVMGIPKPVAIEQLIDKSMRDQSQKAEMVISIHNDFELFMLNYYRTNPGVHEIEGASDTFRALKRAGIKVALDTGFNRVIVDSILRRLGWSKGDLLDATVASDEVVRGRPHPDMIFRVMEIVGVSDARNVAKVGDTPSDLQEGTTAGCGWVIGVTHGSHTLEQLRPFPHTHLIDSVANLPALLLGTSA
jgi:phosphonatase-like hydrolase